MCRNALGMSVLGKHHIVLTSRDFKTSYFHRRLHASLRTHISHSENEAIMNNPANCLKHQCGCLWSGSRWTEKASSGHHGVIRDPLAGTLQEFPPQLSRLFQEAKSSPVLLLAAAVFLNGAPSRVSEQRFTCARLRRC